MAVVLIAEDDGDVSLILHRVFSRAGFTVLAAPDGTSALHTTAAEHPDVVLTDLDMPGMTGLQLCQAIRAHVDLRDTPVALLSGSLHRGDPRAAEAHLCAVVLKPFNHVDLVTTVQGLVDTGSHDHNADPSTCPLTAGAR